MIDLLKNIALFKNLNGSQLEDIKNIVEVKEFEKDEYLIQENVKCEHLFVISRGYARVLTRTQDGEEPFSLLQRGDFLGEVSLIDGRMPSASVVAQQDMEVFVISHDDLKELLKKDRDMASEVLWSLAEVLCVKIRKTTLSLSIVKQKASKQLFI